MKFGMRKPNLKKCIKARTTGKAKRAVKKAINPLYGKKGMGFVNNPKKALYNKVYNKTTFGVNDIIKGSTSKKSNTKSPINSSANLSIDEKKTISREQAYIEKVEPLLKNINTYAQMLEKVDNPLGFSWIYKEAEKLSNKLLKYEDKLEWKNGTSTEALNELKEKKQIVAKKMIERYYNKMMHKSINIFKVDYKKKFYDTLLKYYDEFDEENIKYIEYLYNEEEIVAIQEDLEIKDDEENVEMNKSDKIRYGIGIFLALGGVSSIFSGELLFGLLIIIFGISLLPIIYKVLNYSNNKAIQIIVPIIIFFIMCVSISDSETENISINNVIDNNTVVNTAIDENIVEENANSLIIYNTAEEFEKDLNNGIDTIGKIVKFKVLEYNLNTLYGNNAWAGEHLNFISDTDAELDVDDEVTCKVTSVSKNWGSWYIKYEIIEINKAIEETDEKKELENTISNSNVNETTSEDVIETENKVIEEQIEETSSTPVKTTETTQTSQNNHKETTTSQVTSAPISTPEPTTNSNLVWIPQSGKKYHRSPSCSNMNNPSQVSQSTAEAQGYTPCKKCY